MKKIIIGLIVLSLLLVGCSSSTKQPTITQDSDIEDQYDLWLEDELTGEITSDEIPFTIYKNGTYACGIKRIEAGSVEEAQEMCWELIQVREFGKLFTE